MIDRMTKYSFILLSGKSEEFLRQLSELGLVDVSRSAKPVDEKSSELLAAGQDMTRAATMLEALDYSKDPALKEIEAAVDKNAKHPDPLEEFRDASAKLDSLNAELSQTYKELENVRAWGEFDKAAIEDLASRGFQTRFYRVSKKQYDASWASLYPLAEIFDDGKTVRFVTISDDPDYSLPVDECPAPARDIRAANARIEELKSGIISCKARLLELKEYAPALKEEAGKTLADLQLHLAQAGSGNAAEGLVTTFVGFAPEENEAQLCEEFDKMDVLYVKEAASKEDNPPIKLKGNRITKLFTMITDMYGRPVYDEFDPTPYISIFFTLFFAICMGDAGYGLILIIAGLAARKMESMKSLAPLVAILGVATFVVGIVLHTFFGMDLSQASWVPDWLKSCMIVGNISLAGNEFDAQMLLSILIGIVHLSLAMVLKAIYSVRRDGFLNSLGTLSWTLLLVGAVIVGGFSMLKVIDATATKWIIIVLGCVSAIGIFLLNDIHRNPLINIGSGLYSVYNTVTGLLGDVLSYLRLYALGLAGGMLGNAFNELANSLLGIEVPGLNWILFALMLLIGHTLNLAMSALGAFVHPLRLNFLEFFKNSGYEGTGKSYRPLTTKETLNS